MGKRLLVVGGDAAGMSATVQARRHVPDLEIVVVERSRWTSSSTCGIPYLASGAVHGPEDLVVRTPEDFRAVRVDVRTGHDVVALDLDAGRAEVNNLTHGRSFHLGFDFLLLATGAEATRPEVPGSDLAHVHALRSLDDAGRLLDALKERPAEKVAVVGGSSTAPQLAEAFRARGAAVTLLEPGAEVLPELDPDVSALVTRALRHAGIGVEVGATVTSFEETAVHTSTGEVPADLVVLASGVTPRAGLGAAAGLATGINAALVVDRRQRTSSDVVWAAGDCCQSVHRVSGRATYQPLGGVAVKQGRVAGINLSGGYAAFPGVLGTAVGRVCNLEFGRTGLSSGQAAEAGFSAAEVTVESTTTDPYMPGARPVTVKLVAEKGTGRLLGVQTAGGPGAGKRVDVVASALAGGLTVEDLIGLDLGYAPPLSVVWDPLQSAARVLARDL